MFAGWLPAHSGATAADFNRLPYLTVLVPRGCLQLLKLESLVGHNNRRWPNSQQVVVFGGRWITKPSRPKVPTAEREICVM